MREFSRAGVFLVLSLFVRCDAAFAIEAIQAKTDGLNVIRLAEGGIADAKQSVDEDHTFASRFLYVGCHTASTNIVRDIAPMDLQGRAVYDPNECVNYCMESEFPGFHNGTVIAAVSNEKCGCALKERLHAVFTRADDRFCNTACPSYANELCGGELGPSAGMEYWGVFRDYDRLSMSGPGAYDPWRYIFYQVVSIENPELVGGRRTIDSSPELYYLHAMSTSNGKPFFEYQLPLNGLLYGLQYDIDSSRIVALYIDAMTARVEVRDWSYKLAILTVNTSDTVRDPTLGLPRIRMQMETVTMFRQAAAYQQTDVFSSLPAPLEYLSMTGAAAIVSTNNFSCFVFAQVDEASDKRDMKDRVFIISIPDGKVLKDEPLDFKVLQFLTNEKHGHITALGPRDRVATQEQDPIQQYLYLAKVSYDEVTLEKQVDWEFDVNAPRLLTEERMIDNFRFYPGVSCSEHLFNKSMLTYKSVPVDEEGNEFDIGLSTRPSTVLQVDVLDSARYVKWGENGTIPASVPWAAIYNREPRIPLSLAAPALLEARFDMEAGSIYVRFDQPTLKGARPIDLDGDVLPDTIDYSTQMNDPRPCDEVFNAATVLRLGEGAICEWPASEVVQITLGPDFTIDVGDSLFVKEDTIYTQPRAAEFSMASSGGVTVDMPVLEQEVEVDGELTTVILGPEIVLTGAVRIDSCTGVKLTASDTYQTGSMPIYMWSLVDYTDLTNRPDRVYNESKVQSLEAALAEATEDNQSILDLNRDVMEKATLYNLQLSVRSRWGLETSRVIEITKLDFPAPMVEILGQTEQYANRTGSLSLLAVGQSSNCEGVERKIGYRWSETQGSLNFAEYPDIKRFSKTLVIPPFVLEPEVDYIFNVDCFLVTSPAQVSSAQVSVIVRRSPVFVVLGSLKSSRESRMMTRGSVLILDARESQDPDYPTPEGQTFGGTFKWYCMFNQLPCFDGDTPELDDLDEKDCRLNKDRQIFDGGKLFSEPQFDNVKYCRYARGVVMVKTDDFESGSYRWSVIIESYDGRQAQKMIEIEITEVKIPQVTLEIQGESVSKYPITEPVTITGTLEGDTDPTAVDISYDWEVWTFQLNPDYDPDKAANDPNYNVDQRTFVRVEENDDPKTRRRIMQDTSRYTASEENPTIIVQPCVPEVPCAMKASTTYKFRLLINVGETQGYSDITLETAGKPPSGGNLTVEPKNGTMQTIRMAIADGWIADDQPLSYAFGYLKRGTGQGSEYRQIDFTADALPVSQYEIAQLTQGDADDDYKIEIYCNVRTPYGAKTTVFFTVYSRPPADVMGFVSSQFNDAADAGPEDALNNIDAIMSTNPVGTGGDLSDAENEFMSGMAALLNDKMSDAPATQRNVDSAMTALASMSDAGYAGPEMMNGAEEMALNNPEMFGPDSTATASMLDHLGNMLPDMGDGDGGGAFGSSLNMRDILERGVPTTSYEARRYAPFDEEKGMHHAVHTRSEEPHHPPARTDDKVIQNCDSIFCDELYLTCYRIPQSLLWSRGRVERFTCCDEENHITECFDPPCWHSGTGCPKTRASGAPERRLRPFDMEEFNERFGTFGKKPAAAPRRHNHRHERRLQIIHDFDFPTANRGSPMYSDWLNWLEDTEADLIGEAQKYQKIREDQDDDASVSASRYEAQFSMMEPQIADRERKQFIKRQIRQSEEALERQRELSQTITRIAVIRDIVMKQIIKSLSKNQPPRVYPSSSFTIWVGKNTNLSNVHAGFIFPNKYIVPASSPDDPPPDPSIKNPVTGFSFVYMEYTANVYGWAPSNPAGQNPFLITLMVMRANPEVDLIVQNERPPIRIFADKSLWSSGICYYWDRFASGTAGGAWSPQGILNDGQGCLTTHLSDIGFFLDGRVNTLKLMQSVTAYEADNVTDNNNVNILAYLGFILVLGVVSMIWGFKSDERMREDQRFGRANAPQYWLDGDGLTTPLSVEDPIAYRKVADRNAFILQTFLNVVEREHIVLGSVFYSETFSRPQRLMCLITVVLGVLGINSVIFGSPNTFANQNQWLPAGILSGLLVFPIYCVLFIMFTIRPTQLKKVLIKRRYRSHDLQRIEQALFEAENVANLAPKTKSQPVNSVTKPLVGGLPALPPVPSVPDAHLALPVGGMGRPPPGVPPRAPPQAMLPPIYFSRHPMPAQLPSIEQDNKPALPARKPPPPPGAPPSRAIPQQQQGTPPGSNPQTFRAPPTPIGEAPAPPAAAPPQTPPGTGRDRAAEVPGRIPEAHHEMAPPNMPGNMPGTLAPFVPQMPTGVPPIMPAIPGPLQMGFGEGSLVPAGQPPPGIPPPHKDAKAGPPPARPDMLPTPPPPPREDDGAFVRRVRLVYLDRVTREHQRLDLIESKETGKNIPAMVHSLWTLLPYIAATAICTASLFLIVAFGIKFSEDTEIAWIYACTTGLLFVTLILDVVRVAVVTIVELRKFEIRQRSRAGELCERRVKKEGEDDLPSMLKPKPKRKLIPTPPVPKAPPRYPDRPLRPAWLPEEESAIRNVPMPPAIQPGDTLGEGDFPPQLTGDGARQLPVGPGRPPRQPPGRSLPQRLDLPPEPPSTPPRTPPPTPPGQQPPGRSPRGGTPVGTPGRSAGPPLPGQGRPSQGQPPSPTGSLRSVHSLTGTLAEQLARERSANGQPPPPPIPGGMPSGRGTPQGGSRSGSLGAAMPPPLAGTPVGTPGRAPPSPSGVGNARVPAPPSPSGARGAPPSPTGSARSGRSATSARTAEARRAARQSNAGQ